MKNNLIAKSEAVVNVEAGKVWEALTDPAMIKQYLFGTEAVSDWKVGSPILWRGVWQGKTYEDKGRVLRSEPEKMLECTYWSSMSGVPDVPENYKKVRYELAPNPPAGGGGTKLTITQDNNATEADKKHSEENWNMVLSNLKKLLDR